MCWSAERTFDGDASMPRAARQFVGEQLVLLLGPARDVEAINDAELLVSELSTNSVQSGAATVHVALRVHHDGLELAVTDDGAGWPTLLRPAEHDAHGRGLLLVDALAVRWQAEQVDSGRKRVSVTIAVPAELARSVECHRPRADALERKS